MFALSSKTMPVAPLRTKDFAHGTMSSYGKPVAKPPRRCCEEKIITTAPIRGQTEKSQIS